MTKQEKWEMFKQAYPWAVAPTKDVTKRFGKLKECPHESTGKRIIPSLTNPDFSQKKRPPRQDDSRPVYK